MKHWWHGVLERWHQPQWAADVGLPTLVSVVALMVAFYFFRTQLKNDRKLMLEQLKAARAEVERERRREAVRQLANHLFGNAAFAGYEQGHAPVDLAALTNLIERTTLVAGDQPLFCQASRLAKDCNMRATVVDEWLAAQSGEDAGWEAAYLSRRFVDDRVQKLRLLAEACLSWNGEVELREVTWISVPSEEKVDLMSKERVNYMWVLRNEWRKAVRKMSQ